MNTLRLSLMTAMLVASSYAQNGKSDTLTGSPVYQQNCAKCHGKNAEGRMFAGPSLVGAKTTGMSAEELRDVITNGRHRMPKFAGKLQPAEIDALVDEIKALKK